MRHCGLLGMLDRESRPPAPPQALARAGSIRVPMAALRRLDLWPPRECHHAASQGKAYHAHRHRTIAHRRPVRHRPARPPDGGGRHRRAARDLQAQCAVPARRPPRVLLRLHGRDGAQPLSAGLRLSQGRAREGRLSSATGWKDFQKENDPFWVARGADQLVGLGRRRSQKAIDAYPQVGRDGAADRRRARLPAGRLGHARCATHFPTARSTDALFVLERLRAMQESPTSSRSCGSPRRP